MCSRSPDGYTLFETAMGLCGLAWTGEGICRVVLPLPDKKKVCRALGTSSSDLDVKRPPRFVARAVQRMTSHLSGKVDPLLDIPVDLTDLPLFHAEIYELARLIPPGSAASYGCLARRSKRPNAARAVGRAMARNPVPLLVPCHRIVAFDGALTGFSGPGGLALKAKLLELEGVLVEGRGGRKKRVAPSFML